MPPSTRRATDLARVFFNDRLLPLTGGVRQADLPADNYRDLVRVLNERWPGLGDELEDSAVAIDGEIYQDAWLEPIGATSEVHFLPRIEGG